MGTRADFYVGRGKKAEWLGSIAWDGNPDGLRKRDGINLLGAVTEEDYRKAVREFIGPRDDGTAPVEGWPWPWEDSNTTDYTYAWDQGVWMSHFGSAWRDAKGPECAEPYDDCTHLQKDVQLVFPPTSVGGETITEAGALISKPKQKRAKKLAFPDMSKESNFTTGPRSGVTIIGSGGIQKGE